MTSVWIFLGEFGQSQHAGQGDPLQEDPSQGRLAGHERFWQLRHSGKIYILQCDSVKFGKIRSICYLPVNMSYSYSLPVYLSVTFFAVMRY